MRFIKSLVLLASLCSIVYAGKSCKSEQKILKKKTCVLYNIRAQTCKAWAGGVE